MSDAFLHTKEAPRKVGLAISQGKTEYVGMCRENSNMEQKHL